MRPTKIVHNFDTGITETIELTDEEIAQRETDQAAYEAQQAELAAAEEAKATAVESFNAKLLALGITPEEIAAWRG
jgi:hypothetical protein